MTAKKSSPKSQAKSSPSPSPKKFPTVKKARKPSASPKAPSSAQKPSPGSRVVATHTSFNAFPIVGIGASAGGVEALGRFFSTLPQDSGMGFVVIQHLAPDRESLMPELLARKTSLPIHVAVDETLVEPDHIYLIPPNTQLSIDGGFLRVDRPSIVHGLRTPIDTFFQSLAEDQGPFAIGVILSGAGSDGAVGLRSVKEQGGLTIAQSDETSQFSGMPTSAILTGLIDHILPVEAIAEALILYAKYLYDLRDGKGLETLRAEALNYLDGICSHLHRRTGHDFRGYKRNTMGRRVQRRMQILHIASPENYVKRLGEDPEEVDGLFKELLIGVTKFFRDPEAFAFLSDTIIPKIVKSKHNNEAIRVWIPGCSTGEEVYSLAILFYEYLQRKHLSIPLQIFGTDIDERALDIARRGQYPESIQEDVLPDRLALFFEHVGSCYRVARMIRELCIFSFHNLVGNPLFSRMDVISCRNLLIYMEPHLQNQMFAVFHYSLNPEGYLFLGASEQAEDQSRFFRPVNKPFRVFQPKQIMARTFPQFPIQGPRGTLPTPKPALFPQIQDPFIHIFDHLVREEYGPPAVLIDKECQVQYVSGRTGTYLQLPSGSVNVNLINMVMPDLRVPLRSGIFKAVKTGKEVVHPNIQLAVHDDIQSVDIIVRPLVHVKQSSDLLLVVFREKGLIRKSSNVPKKYSKGEHRTIKELEQEIDSTREDLQTALEELETSNQDLKSSNQELMSVNEELQSVNEELQTSTEELQSINEELETVNAQLSEKVEELDHANSDMENLFRTTDIATLFLNAELCIQKYTPAAQKMFQFLDADIGRPITQLSSFSGDETLLTDIREVLRTSQPKEHTRRFPHDPRTFFSRMTPYQSSDGQTSGVVLTFVDITELRQAEDQVLGFSQQQKVMVEFAQLALQEREVPKVMDECVRLLRQTLPIEMAKVLELLPGEQSLLLRAGVGWKEGLVGQDVVSADYNSQAGYTLISQQPVIVKDLSRESRFSGPSLLIDHQVVSGMSCIIRDQTGNPHGVLGVHSTSKREFREKEVEFLQAMANILASAIQRKNIDTQLQSLTESLERRVDERTQDLLQHQHRLRQLSSDLILTEQRERRRIATELHDYLGQLLVVGKIKISQLRQADLSNQQASLVGEVEESLDEALQYTRDLIPQISPPILYEFGFMAAIRWLAEKMVRYDLHVTVTSHLDDHALNLSESVSIILYQVIRELLLNVMKHAQTQEASILIKQVSSEFFEIEVADRGCGFDLSSTRETHPHFEKFGLLNVQERVEGLGGKCEVLSNVGEGTRVLLKVPFSLQDAELEPIQSTLPHTAVQVPMPGKSEESIRVVLADDHPIFREGLATMLNACPDIQVVGEAENGVQAVERVQTLYPDVVVMDINMPVMNGIEATRRIKANHPSIYIIGLSMHGDNIVMKNFYEAGGNEYVTKGDSFNSFAEVIRSSQKNR